MKLYAFCLMIILSGFVRVTSELCTDVAETFWKFLQPIIKDKYSITIFSPKDDETMWLSDEIATCDALERKVPLILIQQEIDYEVTAEQYASNNSPKFYNGSTEFYVYIYIAKTMEMNLYRLKSASILNHPEAIHVFLEYDTNHNINSEIILKTAWAPHKLLNVISINLKISKIKFINKVEVIKTWRNDMTMRVSVYDPFIMKTNERGYVYTRNIFVNNATETGLDMLEIMLKRLDDVHKYPLRVCMFSLSKITEEIHDENGTIIAFSNPDGELIKVLTTSANFLPVFLKPEDGTTYGVRFKNGTVTGALGTLMRGNADLLGNIRPIMDNEISTYLNPIDDVAFWFLTPQRTHEIKISPASFFTIFSYKVSLFLVFTYLACVLIWYKLQNYHLKRCSRQSIVQRDVRKYSVFKIAMSILGFMIMVSQKINTTRRYERFLLVTICFFFLIVNNVYQGAMVTLLQTQVSSNNIQTMAELAESDLTIFTDRVFYTVLDTGTDDEAMKTLYRKKHITTEYVKTINRIVQKKDAAILLPDYSVNVIWQKYISNTTGKASFHVLKDGPSKRYRAHLIDKKSPYAKRLNGILQRVQQAGLMGFWKRRTVYKYSLGAKIRQGQLLEEDQVLMFSMNQLKIVFVLWMASILICTLIFVTELMMYKYSKKRGTLVTILRKEDRKIKMLRGHRDEARRRQKSVSHV